MISRREFVKSSAMAAAAKTGLPAVTPKRPNLVYVFADELRWRSCGFNGDPYARTQNMDRLAAEGCNFTQCVANTPVCAPYRASLMTGKYQSSTGMVINELRLSPEHECFGHALKHAGYKTAYIGKWHLWANQLGHHYAVKNGFVPPGPYRLGFDDYWSGYNFNHVYVQSPYYHDRPDPVIRKDFEPTGQTDEAIRYLKAVAHGSDPFALFLSWGPPHMPWGEGNVPPEYLDLFRSVDLPLAPNFSLEQDPYSDAWQKLPADYETKVHEWMKVYYGQVANLDWNLGRLLSAIDSLGLANDTIFVFTTDHGEMFGAHGRQGKLIFYEEAARVPFLLRFPGKVPVKSVSEALLGTPDIMPTLLNLMGVRCPSTVEGMDMSSHALGQGGQDHEAAHMQGMGATAAWTDGSEWRALRDHDYTYAIYHKDRKELLFNNRKDPFQLINLAEDRESSSTRTHYRTLSEAFRKEQNDVFEACSWYESHWTNNRNITNTAKGVSQDLKAVNEIVQRWFPDGTGDRTIPMPNVGELG